MLARDQHGSVRRRHAFNGLAHLSNSRGVTDEGRRATALEARIRFLQALDSAQRAPQFDLGPHRYQQAFVVPGLLDVIPGSPAYGFDRPGDAAPGR
ncbi:MAG: hypothetical protein ABIS06_11340 [Vicinamibacterales bacterium]